MCNVVRTLETKSRSTVKTQDPTGSVGCILNIDILINYVPDFSKSVFSEPLTLLDRHPRNALSS